MTRALFLDRDGVINEDYGHVFKINDFVFISGIFELIKKAYDLNMKIFVITNQAGIGRGFYDEEDFQILNKWMCQQFEEVGTPINKVYFCPIKYIQILTPSNTSTFTPSNIFIDQGQLRLFG